MPARRDRRGTMNAPLIPLKPPRRMMAAEVMFLVENGLIHPEARFELMDGEIVPMPSKGRFHEVMRERVELWLKEPWAQPFNVIREHTVIVDDETICEPDFLVYDGDRRIADAPLAGADIRLIIEVADTSWGYDSQQKALKYARFGVAEYWVLHAVRMTARVFRDPGPAGYGSAVDVEPGEAIAPLCAPRAGFRARD